MRDKLRVISDKRQKLIDAVNNSKLKVGDVVGVRYGALNKWNDKSRDDQSITCVIEKIASNNAILVRYKDNSVYKESYSIKESDITSRDLWEVGINPFDETQFDVRSVNFSFHSILFSLDILGDKTESKKELMKECKFKELNWNPFVYRDGEKVYYQRDFVWTLQDKQNLIESIYQGIDCGKIIVRKRAWNELVQMEKNGETELFFNDIVDGKQRLNAVKEFIEEKFPDSYGNYYGDLSYSAQHKLTDHQLFSYGELPEYTEDKMVLRQFLKLNFAGVPQSKEHIEFVKSLL